MKFKLSNYIHISRDEDIMPNAFYLYATRTGAAVEIENLHYDSIQNQDWDNIPTKILETLMLAEAIVPFDEDELASIIKVNQENIKDADTKFLSFTIQPTANCQLGCHYCGQKHSKDVSNNDTNDAIYDRIIGKIEDIKSTVKQVSISWYGGEPLTGLSSIEAISKRLISYCDEHEISYEASMVTNALALKKSTFIKLVEVYRITSFQITIDGTAEFHDLRRMLKTGGPSFDIIFKNLKEIVHTDLYKARKAHIGIRSNVDGQNKQNIFELVDMMHEHGILGKVNFNLAPIHDWGDNGASKINGISKEEFAMFEIDIWLKLHSYGMMSKNNLIPLRQYNVCMVASSTSEVYDAYGNVSSCWEIPYTPVYEDSEYYAGNILKNPELDSSKIIMRDWFEKIPTNDTWCKTCKFFPVCGGACPKHWESGTAPCPSFKQNIDERLFLSKYLSLENEPMTVNPEILIP